MITRIDGTPIGKRGVLTTCWSTTSAAFAPVVSKNVMRVGMIIENTGVVDAWARLTPVEANNLTASNGIKIYPAGNLTIDENFPWDGAIEINAGGGQVDITELYDGGS